VSVAEQIAELKPSFISVICGAGRAPARIRERLLSMSKSRR